jgi:glycosyltransferase involved in cell wall biosynthesis
MIWLYTLFGGKLVWTIHNLKPHSNRWLKAHLRLHRWMAKKADKILVHSSGLIEVVSDKYQVPKDKIELLAHPIFPAEIQDKESARLELNKRYQLDLPMNCLVLGSLGAISDYKDFDQILRIMAEFNFSGIYMVFGYVKKGQQDLHNRLSKADKAYDWFIYKPGFVEESDIPIIMNSMDYSLFNFKDISTSGGVELARAYQKDIIAPKKGTLVDYEAEESVQLFSSEDELKTLLTTLSVKP